MTKLGSRSLFADVDVDGTIRVRGGIAVDIDTVDMKMAETSSSPSVLGAWSP